MQNHARKNELSNKITNPDAWNEFTLSDETKSLFKELKNVIKKNAANGRLPREQSLKNLTTHAFAHMILDVKAKVPRIINLPQFLETLDFKKYF